MNPVKTSAKDFFLNLGVIVTLYTAVISLINLLFVAINSAYPQTTNDYVYYGSQSISWPVAILIIFFPIFVLLSWLLEKGFKTEPEKRNLAVRKWLSYITLFVAGVAVAIDLVTVLYMFLDGQDLTMAFLLKILVVLVIASGVFMYFITDIRDKMTGSLRKIWLAIAVVIILASIVWGFTVLGSPATQRLLKYDTAKVQDLMNISSAVSSYYANKQVLPKDFSELETQSYYINKTDSQTNKTYEYSVKTKTTYELCAEFNKALDDSSLAARTYPYGGAPWTHPAGRHCFTQSVNTSPYGEKIPL